MAQPVHVIALLEVFTRMGTAAFLAGFSCAADGFWMLVTTLFCVGWWVVIRFRPVAKPASVASATPNEVPL